MATQQKQRNLGRLSEIAQVAVRHGFGYFFARNRLSDLLPWGERIRQIENNTLKKLEGLPEAQALKNCM